MLFRSLATSMARIGTVRKRTPFVTTLSSTIVEFVVLILGGFFQTIGWPQVVLILIAVAGLGLNFRTENEEHTPDVLSILVGYTILIFLLAKGGFFA